MAGKIARDIGFGHVSVSSDMLRRIRGVGRTQTTMVDAYLSPIRNRYIESVHCATGGVPVSFMQSSGGLARGWQVLRRVRRNAQV